MSESEQVPQVIRVGAYGRVSEKNAMSVASQMDANDAWVAREPTWTCVFRRGDDGISASKYSGGKRRPEWELVLDDIREGRIDILIVWELNRASRDRMVFATLFAMCGERDVRIGVGGRLYDVDDPDDAFALDLLGALAVRESGITSKRIRRGGRSRALTGKPHGKIPYGYARVYDQHTKKFIRQEFEPESYAILREIVDRLLAGEGTFTISNDLNKRNIPSPGEHAMKRRGEPLPEVKVPWRVDQINRFAKDPTWAGFRTHKGQIVGLGDWPAIIEPDEHETLVALVESRKTNIPGSYAPRYLLTGIALCGLCGSKMVKVNNGNSPSYVCKVYFHVVRVKAPVDELVSEAIIARLERDDAADLFVPQDDSVQRAALKELKILEDRLASFTSEASAGRLTAARLGMIEADLLPQIEKAKQQSRPVHLPDELIKLIESDVPRKTWEDDLDLMQKRTVIKALLDVRILPKIKAAGGTHRFNPKLVRLRWHHPSPEELAADQQATEAS